MSKTLFRERHFRVAAEMAGMHAGQRGTNRVAGQPGTWSVVGVRGAQAAIRADERVAQRLGGVFLVIAHDAEHQRVDPGAVARHQFVVRLGITAPRQLDELDIAPDLVLDRDHVLPDPTHGTLLDMVFWPGDPSWQARLTLAARALMSRWRARRPCRVFRKCPRVTHATLRGRPGSLPPSDAVESLTWARSVPARSRSI